MADNIREEGQKAAFEVFSTIFDNAFNAMITFQEHNEKTFGNLIGMAFRQLDTYKKDSIKNYHDWMKGAQDSRREFKSAVDEGYAVMKNIMKASSPMKDYPAKKER